MIIEKITSKSCKKFELMFDSNVVSTPFNNSFVRDFLDKEELSNYSVVLRSENKEISFDELSQLDIKITNVGTMSFFFLKETFKKDEIINDILVLKEIETNNEDNKKKKIKKLCDIVSSYNPILSLYLNNENNSITADDLNDNKFSIIYIVSKRTIDKIKDKDRTPTQKFFSSLWKDKLYYIFSLIAGLIIAFAAFLGIYNCYPNNAVYIFFFICTIAGGTLLTFIFKDVLNKFTYKNKIFVASVICLLIGIAASIGIFIAYYNALKNIPEFIPGYATIILIGSLISIAVTIIAIFLPILFKKIIKKK